MGCRHGVPNLRSQRPITATTQTHQGVPKGRTLILPTLPDHLGSPMWTRRPRLTHTHNLAGTIVPQEGRTTIDTCCVPGPRHRDGVGMPDTGLHPHREAMHKQHTEPRPSCCVCPFGDPHVHNVTTSKETKPECSHSSANTLGPVHHMARTHQTDDKSK